MFCPFFLVGPFYWVVVRSGLLTNSWARSFVYRDGSVRFRCRSFWFFGPVVLHVIRSLGLAMVQASVVRSRSMPAYIVGRSFPFSGSFARSAIQSCSRTRSAAMSSVHRLGRALAVCHSVLGPRRASLLRRPFMLGWLGQGFRYSFCRHALLDFFTVRFLAWVRFAPSSFASVVPARSWLMSSVQPA